MGATQPELVPYLPGMPTVPGGNNNGADSAEIDGVPP
jgi:hypothetical protein